MQEIRFGMRALRRNPGLTLAAVFVLAAGIGANTAVFSAVYAILLKPLPYSEPSRLVVTLHDGRAPVSPADYLDYRSQSTLFTDMAAAQAWSGMVQTGETSEIIRGMQITPNMIPLLGVPPMLGRSFAPGEENALLLSYRLWQRQFAGDANVLNRVLNVNGKTYTIAGVMPPQFRFAPFWQTEAEMWTALPLAARIGDRAGRSLRVFARLRPGVSIAQAQTQMNTLSVRLASAYPKTNTNLGIEVVSLQEKAAGPLRPALLLLLGTAGLVLVIACADIGNLLLARAASRRREIATRIALGATRMQLSRMLAAESLLLSAFGGALGILLAKTALRLLTSYVPAAGLPRQTEMGLNLPVLLFAIAVSIGVGLLAALAPSLQSARVHVNENLNEGGRGASLGRGSRRTQNALIAAQVSLALVLLVCAGLLTKSLRNLNSVDAGFDPRRVLTFEVTTPQANPALAALIEQTLAAQPDVEAVSAINHLPIGGDTWTLNYAVAGRPAPLPGHEAGAVYRVVRPHYFSTMRIRLTGRDFTPHDDTRAPAVAIVNQTLAHRQWPGESAVGKQLVFQNATLTVVGVAADVRQSDWTSPIDDELYLPYAQRPPQETGINSQAFVARMKSDPERLVPRLHFAAAVSQIRPMEQVIADKIWQSRVSAWLLAGFAAIALALASAGIYGVIAYSVRTREQEISIRMALGATKLRILGMVARETTAPLATGMLTGFAGALAATRFLSTLLYHVPATDPATFALVALLMLASSAAAVVVPVSRVP